MPTPQPGVLPAGGPHAYFLTFATRDGAERSAWIRAIQDILPTARALAVREKRARLLCVLGIGSSLWDRLSPANRPAGLRPFRAVEANGLVAPATGGDLLVQISSGRHDLNLDLAMRLTQRLQPLATVGEEIHGFRYQDSRDLTGFIDGTENPKGKARAVAALIGAEDRRFAGGSYVAVQRYVHDLERWRQLDDREQERIIGRTKRTSIELPKSKKPDQAHISRVVIERDGKELQILRQSYPWGTVREAGLYFVAYTKSLDIFDLMLARMIGATDDGRHDRLMEFSRAVTGATFFAPSMDTIASLKP
ncbi:MAG TPA: Dyp-type peroxidase [Nitrospira sp.]|nr:Dyp-type peroxidase [Nitrospira sp.]